MGLTDTITEARKRGATDEMILQKFESTNPDKAEALAKARQRGAPASMILDEMVRQNPVTMSETAGKPVVKRIQDVVQHLTATKVAQSMGVWKEPKESGDLMSKVYESAKTIATDPAKPELVRSSGLVGLAAKTGNAAVGEAVGKVVSGESIPGPFGIALGAAKKFGEFLMKQTVTPEVSTNLSSIKESFTKGKFNPSGVPDGGISLEDVVNKYKDFASENPNIASVLTDTKDVAEFLANFIGLGEAEKLATKEGKDLLKKVIPDVPPGGGGGGNAILPKNAGPSKASNAASGLAKFVVSQATGLNTSTIKEIVSNPGAFSPGTMTTTTRASLGNKVQDALKASIESLSELGEGYDPIRASNVKVKIPSSVIDSYSGTGNVAKRAHSGIIHDVLGGMGISLSDSGRISAGKGAPPLSGGDISSLERFINQYGKDGDLTPHEFLNLRSGLSELSAFDKSKTKVSEDIARELRARYDKIGKTEIPGLEELDAEYAPRIKELDKLRADYLNADGTLKDLALNRIAGMTGKGQDEILSRLEGLVPGITKEIDTLKAVEDIAHTKEHKLGTYGRGAVSGFVTTGGSPIGAAIGAIIASPDIAVPLLRKFGEAKGKANGAIESIIKKIEAGKKLSPADEKVFAERAADFVAKGGSIPNFGNLKDSLVGNGGITYNIPKAASMAGEKAFAVSVFPNRASVPKAVNEFTTEDLTKFIEGNFDVLSDERFNVGGWIDDGQVYLDVSKLYSSQEKAVAAGKALDQISVSNLYNIVHDFDNAFIPTGGTGSVSKMSDDDVWKILSKIGE